MKNLNFLLLIILIALSNSGCYGLIASTARVAQNEMREQTTEAFTHEFEGTAETQLEIMNAFLPTREARLATEIASPKNDFNDFSLDYRSFIFVSLIQRDRVDIYSYMTTAVNCEDLFSNVPTSEVQEPIEERFMDLLGIFSKKNEIEISGWDTWELSAFNPANYFQAYNIFFPDDNNNENDDRALTFNSRH